jgi:hypothetical protein
MRNRKWLSLLTIVLAVGLVACSDPYGLSVKAGADVAVSISQGMQTVDQLRVQTLITPQEESRVLDYLEFANLTNSAYLTCVQNAHTAGTKTGAFTQCAQVFVNAISAPDKLALVRIVNPSAQQTVIGIANTAINTIKSVVALLGGK